MPANHNHNPNPDHLPDPTGGLPPWMALMRQAAMKCIRPGDIEAMIQAQVDKAKKGDERAAKFVFDQVLGGATLKGATFIQNVYPEAPEKPAHDPPGSNGKIRKMQQRVAAGRSVFNSDDNERDLD
jgi:hypothetical protein